MKTNDGRLIVVAGASRSGKTTWVKSEVSRVKRICAWDPDDQWARLRGWKRVTTKAELFKLLQKPGPLKAAFVVGGDLSEAFNFWAGLILYSGRYVQPLVAIAEELADVSTPNKAPGNWGILLRRGLKRGITIYAISQRWAEADKTALGNASEFVIFRQGTGMDSKYMARYTRVPQEEIDGLESLQYVKYDPDFKKIDRGRLPFRRKKQ